MYELDVHDFVHTIKPMNGTDPVNVSGRELCGAEKWPSIKWVKT